MAKQPYFSWGTFSLFTVIATLWNYFACRLLLYYLGS